MCFFAARAFLSTTGRSLVEAASKKTASSGFLSASSRSVVQRSTPCSAASFFSFSALRPTRIGSGITRVPSASSTPPSLRMAMTERARCWFVPMRPVTPFMMTPSLCSAMATYSKLSLPVLPDANDLHRVGSAGLADRLTDGEHDEVPLLHHAVPHQDVFGLFQQLFAVVTDVLHHQGIGVAKQRATIARYGLRGESVDRNAAVDARHPKRGRASPRLSPPRLRRCGSWRRWSRPGICRLRSPPTTSPHRSHRGRHWRRPTLRRAWVPGSKSSTPSSAWRLW